MVFVIIIKDVTYQIQGLYISCYRIKDKIEDKKIVITIENLQKLF